MRSLIKSRMIFTLLLTQCFFSASSVAAAQGSKRANVPVQIRSFHSTDYRVKGNDNVVISWDIAGASKIQLVSSKGLTHENLAAQGELSVSTTDLTQFTLIASGAKAGAQVSQSLSIIRQSPAPEPAVPKLSLYIQPLYALGLQPIERSLLTGKNNNNYVADLQQKLHQISDVGQIIWTIDLQGLIANQPIYLTNDNDEAFLFFALSKSNLIDTNTAGQFCRLTIANKALHCVNLQNNAIAGPAVYSEEGFLSSTPRLFQIDVKGVLHEFSAFDEEKPLLISRQQLLLNENAIRVLTTPRINALTKQIIVRSEKNDLVVYPLPKVDSFVSQSFMAMSEAFSIKDFSNEDTPNEALSTALTQTNETQINQQTTQINPVWSRKFD